MVAGGIGLHVEDILVSLVLSIIISWTFRILAKEENQYSFVYKILGYFLSKAHKQTKAGPRISGTPFLVIVPFIVYMHWDILYYVIFFISVLNLTNR